MDKKYTVFLSSTYDDLREERNEVIHALLEMNCIPCGMEYFPSDNDKQFEFIKSVIDESDYYILIIAGRYGSIGKNGKSYTEMEYRYAIEKSIPVLIFLHNDIGAIHLDKSERNEQNRRKLEKFMQDVSKDRMVKYWNGKEDLARKVSTTMFSVMERHPAAGWIKGTPFLEEMVSTYDKNDSRIEDELAEIAYHCKMQENFKQAHLFLKWGYLLSPENINVLREYGGLCYDEKNYAQALVYWEKLLSLQESCGNYYICALTYYLLGKYTEAKEYCYSALKFPDEGYREKAKELLKNWN
ncbi:DUF4062 domain-containing protein [Parablautia muri]|uniref:DUF4062 domain-containing protein n=1 Tax=Parablautia muri TaxID=2320879 RepID=A0A9X5BHW4_9FIRM|nr:DUF4062 domain-containing protein [Parablautia muri]NBJ94411.1 DUF4062 domain-containing protein [Parablautia muri]